MSGRARVTLADGRRVIGFRKTLARRPRTPPHLLPQWRFSFEVPPESGGFALLPGPYPGVIGIAVGKGGHIEIAHRDRRWMLNQVAEFLRKAVPYGFLHPIPAVLERGDEPGPTLSGPLRKGEKRACTIVWTGREPLLIEGAAMRPLAAPARSQNLRHRLLERIK
jgi:hypothetical protein